MTEAHILIGLLILIAIFLYNIQHFCKGIKRDLFGIVNAKNEYYSGN